VYACCEGSVVIYVDVSGINEVFGKTSIIILFLDHHHAPP